MMTGYSSVELSPGAGKPDFGRVLDRFPEMIWVMQVEPGPSYRCVAATDAAVRATGFPREKVVGMTIEEFLPADEVARTLSNLNQAIDVGGPFGYERTITLPIGTRTFEAFTFPIFGQDESCSHIVAFSRDINPAQPKVGEDLEADELPAELEDRIAAIQNQLEPLLQQLLLG